MIEQKNRKIKLLISIVLYQPNKEDFIKLFSSIKNSNLENIICDVCFLDNSNRVSEFIKKHTNEFKKENQNENLNIYYIISQKNLGYGGGNNFTYFEFKGVEYDYFLIINPDIYFNETLIKNLIEKMQNNQEIGLSSIKILNTDNSIQYVHRKFPSIFDIFFRVLFNFINLKKLNSLKERISKRKEMQDSYKNENSFKAEMISGCFMCFKSEIFDKLKGFSDKFFMYYEDLDISKRCNRISQNIVFTDLSLYHKWRRESSKDFKLFIIHLKSFFRYYF